MQALGVDTAEGYQRLMSGREVHLLLKDKAAGMPQVGSLSLFNADGKLFNFSRFWPIPDIAVTDRDFFRALKSDPASNRSWASRCVTVPPGPGPSTSRAGLPARTASSLAWYRARWR